MTAWGQSFDRCPKAELRDAPEAQNAIADWDRYERRGVLPHAGGFLDQPARFVESLAVIQGEMSICRKIGESLRAGQTKKGGA